MAAASASACASAAGGGAGARVSGVTFANVNATSDPTPDCPLCRSTQSAVTHHQLHARRYWSCPECSLAFMDPKQRLEAAKEKERYDFHENSPNDKGYVKFLNRLLEPFAQRLPAGAKGLDYGCGPGPTISVLLERKGFSVDNYDPFYFPDKGALSATYDFVTCTEAIEHFYDPRVELTRIDHVLRRDTTAWIGLMTEPLLPTTRFETWHYARDPTHVCFFRPQTLDFICRWLGWTLVLSQKNVHIFSRPPVAAAAPAASASTSASASAAAAAANTKADAKAVDVKAAATDKPAAAAPAAAAAAAATGGSVSGHKHPRDDAGAAAAAGSDSAKPAASAVGSESTADGAAKKQKTA